MWSPNSDVFFVGHAGPAGKGSVLRMFKRQGAVFADDTAFDQAARGLYGRKSCTGGAQSGCVAAGMVAGRSGRGLYAEAQERAVQGCHAYTAVEMGLADRTIRHVFTPEEIPNSFPGCSSL